MLAAEKLLSLVGRCILQPHRPGEEERDLPLGLLFSWQKEFPMRRMFALVSFAMLSASLFAVNATAEPLTPAFRAETIDPKVQIGYGLVIGDVNGDQKPDILLADKTQFVWYENPSWERHVMVDGLTERDNVCLAARDVDGDGMVKVAVGAQWNPGETSDVAQSGSVHYLVRPADPRQKWKPIRLPHEPTVHRMRWIKDAQGQAYLVVLPLHGRGNKGGEGAGVRILAYALPDDPTQPWKTVLLDESLHMTHNFDPILATQEGKGDGMIVGGKEGLLRFSLQGGEWKSSLFQPEGFRGAGEVRTALSGNDTVIATIEPMHGNEAVVYVLRHLKVVAEPIRVSLTDTLEQGHALALDDLLNAGRPQVVVGWRNPNKEGKVGIKLFVPESFAWNRRKEYTIDDNTMACEDLRVADLNGDGLPEIVAAGRATNNLIIYWNESK